MTMNDNEYKCANCGGVFEKGRSDEEALAASRDMWGALPMEELSVICDDCFNALKVDHQ